MEIKANKAIRAIKIGSNNTKIYDVDDYRTRRSRLTGLSRKMTFQRNKIKANLAIRAIRIGGNNSKIYNGDDNHTR